MNKNEQGFTLTELLVTLAILAIVTAGTFLIGSKIIQGNEHNAFENDCQHLLALVLSAQQDALTLNNSVTCQFRVNVFSVTQYEHGKVKKKHTTFEHLSFGTDETKSVVFNSNGVASKGMTVNLFSASGEYKNLVIQLVSGRIYLSDAQSK